MSSWLRYLRYDFYFGENCETCRNNLKNALNTGEEFNIDQIISLAKKTETNCNVPRLEFYRTMLEKTYNAFSNDEANKYDVLARKYELRSFMDDK
jgi:hypothetical protein